MKWDCIICKKNIHHNSYSVPCQKCKEYAHIKCADVSKTAKNVEWICLYCFRPAIPRVSPDSASLVGPGDLQEQAGCERGREPGQAIAGDVRPNFQNPVNPQSQQTPEQSFWAALEKPEDLLPIYQEIVHWKPSFMRINKCKAGNSFTNALNDALKPLADQSANAPFSLLAAMIMPHLLLCRTKKADDNSANKTLSRRLDLWFSGKLTELFHEAGALQKRKPAAKQKVSEPKPIKRFMMKEGKVSGAMRVVAGEKGGVLPLKHKIGDSDVLSILLSKHPPASSLNEQCLVTGQQPLAYHPAVFEIIDAALVEKAVLRTNGAHGPSGLDSAQWRRILTCFEKNSDNLKNTVAAIAKRIATQKLESETLMPYNSCRLIPLDKNPGVRPIGIGEVIRRIVGRCIAKRVDAELRSIGGNDQLCMGQTAGIEYSIHSMRTEFEKDSCEALLLIDATNAFNNLNRATALENIRRICPSIYCALNNSYQTPSNLYVDKQTLLSQEGCTQGDPLARLMYGIASRPLIDRMNMESVSQKWHADDGTAAGTIEKLLLFFKQLNKIGEGFGYFVNAPKCQLIVKPHTIEKAKHIFNNTNVQIVDGARVLGSVIGSEAACQKFVQEQSETTKTSEEPKRVCQIVTASSLSLFFPRRSK